MACTLNGNVRVCRCLLIRYAVASSPTLGCMRYGVGGGLPDGLEEPTRVMYYSRRTPSANYSSRSVRWSFTAMAGKRRQARRGARLAQRRTGPRGAWSISEDDILWQDQAARKPSLQFLNFHLYSASVHVSPMLNSG